MSDLVTADRNAVYNYLMKGTAMPAAPAGTYLALSTDGATELSGNGYARVDIRAAMSAPTDGVGSNSTNAEFPAATGNQGTITHAAIFDASSAGTRRSAWKALPTPRAINTGDILRFPIGDIDFSVQ